MKSTNQANFKTKVLKFILAKRQFVSVANNKVLQEYLPDGTAQGFWYDIKEFVAHADRTYKVDLARQRVFDQAEGINRIRLAHCFCLPDNHDAALKYGGGKATTRSDVDDVASSALSHLHYFILTPNETITEKSISY